MRKINLKMPIVFKPMFHLTNQFSRIMSSINKCLIKSNGLAKLTSGLKHILIENNHGKFTETTSSKFFPIVKIKNFGQMDERFYRGAQPKKRDYQSLASLGVKTVIDLRDKPTDYEKSSVEALGIKYINIPMNDKHYPTSEKIEAFLNLVNEPSTGIFYVHCVGGRHRTSVVGAVYRFTKYGWDFDRVYKEMKNYDFYTYWGHRPLKDFVIDYGEKMKGKSINLTII